MSQKQSIFSGHCINPLALHQALESLTSITGSQLIAIKTGASLYLPALVSIAQRTNKGTLSVTVDDIAFTVSQRGKINKVIKLLT